MSRALVEKLMLWLTASAVLAGCSVGTCADPSEAALAALPQRLSETGRFDAGVIEYTPAFELWSDGAAKRRAIALPPGEQIDTTDLDDWRFPKGTRLWKDFVRDGVLVETRFITRYGDADDEWAAASYVWSGDDAELRLDGESNANGTPHDVPGANKCQGCHGGRASYVLGFSAIQLANADRSVTGFDLDVAIGRGMLSAPPSTASLRVPGNPTERTALGYLHANCAHCHNQDRPKSDGPRCYDPRREFDLLLRADELGDVAQTATYRTAVSQGQLAGALPLMMQFQEMPPLAVESVDADGLAALRAWVDAL